MKKLLSVALALIMVLGVCVCASAGIDAPLKFSEDGKFRIVNICDIQDSYPMQNTTKVYLNEMLKTLKPDVVILGGDNTVAGMPDEQNYTVIDGKKVSYDSLTDEQYAKVEDEYFAKVLKVKEASIKELCDIFVENQTYFTLVFGNHDHQQFGRFNERNREKNKEILLGLYQKFGGKYCLAYDADRSLYGVGTHNLPVFSADNQKVLFNLYMMDSNTYYFNEDGVEMGYDAVHPDQLRWYEGIADGYKKLNGGKVVPAFMFQHIVVQEVYEKLFIETPFDVGAIGEDFEDVDGTVHHYIYLPKVGSLEKGYLFEKPCPGYKNYGQLDSVVKTGDVKAIFSGHDHTDSYTVKIDGIDITNTAGCTYHSYGSDLNRGVRVIDLDAKDLSTYKTYNYTVCEAAMAENSEITTCDNSQLSKFAAGFNSIFGIKFMDAFIEVLKVVFFWSKWL